MAADEAVRVIVVTGVRLYAEGLAAVLERDGRLEVAGVAAGCEQALTLLRETAADVALLDLAGVDDADGAATFAHAARPARVVALAVRETDADVVAWAERGVAGLVTRGSTADQVAGTVRAAARGEAECSPAVAGALLRHVAALGAGRRAAAPEVALTTREREIATLLAQGLTNKEIAGRLLLGVSTVKNHVHHLLGKLDAGTRGEAAARLAAAGELGREPDRVWAAPAAAGR